MLELIGRRGSCREFAAASLALADLAALLAGTYGLTRRIVIPEGFSRFDIASRLAT